MLFNDADSSCSLLKIKEGEGRKVSSSKNPPHPAYSRLGTSKFDSSKFFSFFFSVVIILLLIT